MAIFIALLRGINVGGQKKIAIRDLKELFSEPGFHDATTYIQSGNIIFGSDESNSSKITKSIEREIRDRYSYDVAVLVHSLDELFGTDELRRFKLRCSHHAIHTQENHPLKPKCACTQCHFNMALCTDVCALVGMHNQTL